MSTVNPCRIYGDCWVGVLNHEWHTDNPSEVEFEQAHFRLDAKQYTMVTIAEDGEKHLTIGGGGGRYVVYATSDNEEFWNLLRPGATNGPVLLNAGGQEGDYPATQVVTLEQARAAGLEFIRSRELDPGQQWEKQD